MSETVRMSPAQGAAANRGARRFAVGRIPGFGAATWAFFLFLYAPIALLVVFSFNGSNSATIWSHFSLDWYVKVAANSDIQRAALNSLIVAGVASTLATALATFAALAMVRGGPFRGQQLALSTLLLPLIVPEIVIAIAMVIFFTGIGLSLGLGNLIIAHTVFCIPFAYLPIRARLDSLSPVYEEAAQDLYADNWRTFWHVTFPLLAPGILAGLMLAFITSVDDFIISLMVGSAGTTTLPIYIYSLIRIGITPQINAISTLVLLISFIFVSLAWLIARRSEASP
ncbi:ABC transporter permease [Pelagibius sp.]|uniref:ABC transporter permease n=1 Tax=Pelagibius sp. TaxID=1931238 RepID=UPI00262F71F1|nr:ABC transporter permease [Pelagibius sp.]